MSSTNPSLGQQVRHYREARGWTRKQLAHQVGCAVVTLQKVERDERRPSTELMQLLAQVLQLTVAQTTALLPLGQSMAADLLSDTPVDPSLVGRSAELQHIATLLTTGQTRLLTLTGPGGVGKTRLAEAMVAALASQFNDGACTVELASLSHPDLLLDTLARAVALSVAGDQPLLKSLLAFLHTKQLLLSLDNFEHLLSAAPLLAQLLAGCSHLVILVTSREPLRVAGEMVMPVEPLALPSPSAMTQNPLTAALASPAVALFVLRAQAVKPTFTLTAENGPAIAQLCIHLDGLPLAIELVAARIRLFSPTALLTRFVSATGQPRIGLLAQPSATLPGSQPARHRTLHETLDWSYQLLNRAEQSAFCRFALFADGCTLAAAEALLHDEQETGDHAAVYAWDLLGSLLDKSLLYQRECEGTEREGETRFLMLETIREYAREQLMERNDLFAMQRRYAWYYQDLAQLFFDRIVEGVNVESWLAAAAQEHMNFRAALTWAIAHGEGEVAVAMATALWRYWWIRGHWQEGRGWLEQALQGLVATTEAANRLRARALRSLGGLCVTQGDHRAARTYLEQSIALAQAVGDDYVESLALSSLATLCCSEGDFAQAETLLLQSMAYDFKTNNARDLAVSYGMLGEIGLYQADYAKAEKHLQQALQLQHARGDEHSLMITQLNLGHALFEQARYEAAQSYLAEGLRLARSLGNPLAEATGLQQLAELHFMTEQPEVAFPLLLDAFHCAETHNLHRITATLLRLLGEQVIKQGELAVGVRLLGGCAAVESTWGIVLEAQEQSRVEQLLARLRTTAPPDLVEDAYQKGRYKPLTSTLADARRLCAAR